MDNRICLGSNDPKVCIYKKKKSRIEKKQVYDVIHERNGPGCCTRKIEFIFY